MHIRNQEGVIVLVAMLISGALLSIVITLSLIFSPRLRASTESKHSVGALYAADSAIEWCLYRAFVGPADAPAMNLDATYSPTDSAACLTPPVKATGNLRGTTRALEVTF